VTPALRKLVVVGVGLIGGSAALALKRRGIVGEVVGVGRTRANLDAALAKRVVDRAFAQDEAWTRELCDADVVLIATPVAQLPALLTAMAGSLGDETLVTDAGSTKADVVKAARAKLGAALARFVPAHPIAGTEHSGAAAAFASLFDGRQVIATPLPETDARALARIRALWEACGASVATMEPEAHDRALAAVSHLPHLLSSAYVAELAARPDARALFAVAGSGFRDFTRIAGASPEMWRDVALANRAALHAEIGALRSALDAIEAAMRAGDGNALQRMFETASAARRAWATDKDDR
jgi:prephenate dehydrogenase